MSITIYNASKFTGKINSMKLPLTLDDYNKRLKDWLVDRVLIQDAFPMLNADQREFLMTGATPEEWDDMFSKGDDE